MNNEEEEGSGGEHEQGKNKLSLVSKVYDLNNDGRLSKTERELRDMDTAGVGHLDNRQVHRILSELHNSQESLLSAKRIIIILGVALLLQALVLTGVVFVAVYLSKDFKPNSNGQLTNMKGDAVVVGGHSYELTIVPGDGPERSESCMLIEEAASIVHDASSNIPVDIKLISGEGDQETLISFALGSSVQEYQNKICISKNGSDEAFLCLNFESNSCEPSDEEELVDGSRRMLRRRLFDESRKNYMSTMVRTIGSRNLAVTSSTSVLAELEYGLVTAEPEEDQTDIFDTGTSQYAVYYTIKKQIDGSWYYWVMDAPTNTDSSFSKNCDGQRGGYLSGVNILLKKETEVDPSSPEANWRFDSNRMLVNRLNGRKVSVDDTTTYDIFGSDPGYLKGDFDNTRKLLPISAIKSGTSTYYLITSEGFIYASDSEKKLRTRVYTQDTRFDCLYNYRSNEAHCDAWKCPSGNSSCKAVWKMTNAGYNSRCKLSTKGYPVCRTYTKNGSMPSYVDNSGDKFYQSWTVEKVDPSTWTPPDLERSNAFVAAVEATGMPNVQLDALKTGIEATKFMAEAGIDIVLEEASKYLQVFAGMGLGVGIGVITAILEFNAEDQIDQLYDELMTAIDELREEMEDGDIRATALGTVQTIGPAIYGPGSIQEKWFDDNLRTFKFSTLFNALNIRDDDTIKEDGMFTLYRLNSLLQTLDGHINSLSCLASNNILEDCSNGTSQFHYTVRYGWKLYTMIYVLYMSIFQEYYELLAYLLSKDLFDNVGPGSLDCPDGISSIDDVFTTGGINSRACSNEFAEVPDKDDFDKAIRNMDSARSSLLEAFDTNFGNAWEQKCEHDYAGLKKERFLYEFCETKCSIGEIGFQRQECYEDMSTDYSYLYCPPSYGSSCTTIINPQSSTDKDPYIELKYDDYKPDSQKCNSDFIDPIFLNVVKHERRISMETYYSMVFPRSDTGVPTFDGSASSSSGYSDYFELHSTYEELLRDRFDQILQDPRHYEELARYQKDNGF